MKGRRCYRPYRQREKETEREEGMEARRRERGKRRENELVSSFAWGMR